MYPFLSCSTMNSYTSSLSSLDNRYTLPFLGIKPSFVSMVWSHSFLVGILSLTFLLKIWIHLWNFSRTSFLAFASDFAVSSSSSQISHSSATLFTSIVFSFLFSFSSHFLPAFSFASSSFCFCHPDFPCFSLHCLLHSSEHLVILTFSVFQSISGLWQANYGIPKITLHF